MGNPEVANGPWYPMTQIQGTLLPYRQRPLDIRRHRGGPYGLKKARRGREATRTPIQYRRT